MKKITKNLLLLLMVFSILTIVSCGEDDEPTAAAPSVSVSASIVDGDALSDGDEVIVGSEIEVTISITAPGGVNGLNITSGSETQSFSRSDLDAEAGDTQASTTLFTDADTEGEVLITFEAVDDLNQTATTTLSYTVIAAPSPDAKVQTAIILAAPLEDGSSTTFYSVGENLLYSHNDVVGTAEVVSPNIDFGYYFGNSDGATLVSPSEYPAAIFDISAWGTRNETPMFQIVDFSSEDFIALTTVEDVTNVLETLSDETFVTGYSDLEVGTVLAFETAAGTAGILRVQSLSTGFTGSIELEMILAEAAE